MSRKPYVVAIAGGTCSGKTTLTKRLQEQLSGECSLCAMGMDSYFMKNPPVIVAPITRREYVEHNSPAALELDRLYADFEAASKEGSGYDIVIVEGLFALQLDPIRERADLKVFVDLMSDERLARRIPKFMKFGESFEQCTARFLDTVRFRHNELVEPTRWHADMVINGTLDSHQGVEILLSWLRQHI